MKKVLAFIASFLLIFGTFLPMIDVSDRSYSFFEDMPPPPNVDISPDAMHYAGAALILVALISGVLAFLNRTKFLWLSGLFTFMVLAGVYFGFNATLAQVEHQAINFLKDLIHQFIESVKLNFTGW